MNYFMGLGFKNPFPISVNNIAALIFSIMHYYAFPNDFLKLVLYNKINFHRINLFILILVTYIINTNKKLLYFSLICFIQTLCFSKFTFAVIFSVIARSFMEINSICGISFHAKYFVKKTAKKGIIFCVEEIYFGYSNYS